MCSRGGMEDAEGSGPRWLVGAVTAHLATRAITRAERVLGEVAAPGAPRRVRRRGRRALRHAAVDTVGPPHAAAGCAVAVRQPICSPVQWTGTRGRH